MYPKMPLTERVSFRTTPNRFRKIPHIEGEYLELWSYSNAAQSKQELKRCLVQQRGRRVRGVNKEMNNGMFWRIW